MVPMVAVMMELKVQWGSETDGEGSTGQWVLMRPDSVEVQGWGTHRTQIPGVWGWVVHKPVDGGMIEGLQNENMGRLGKSRVLGTGLNAFHAVPVLSLTIVLSGRYLLTEVNWTCPRSHSQQISEAGFSLRSVSWRAVLLRNHLWKRILTFETGKITSLVLNMA